MDVQNEEEIEDEKMVHDDEEDVDVDGIDCESPEVEDTILDLI
jgi:hypothetical protein